jgi:hypothetical protein
VGEASSQKKVGGDDLAGLAKRIGLLLLVLALVAAALRWLLAKRRRDEDGAHGATG